MAQQLVRSVGSRLASGGPSSLTLWPNAGLGFLSSGRSFSAACCPEAPNAAANGQIIESRCFHPSTDEPSLPIWNIKELYSVGDLQDAIRGSNGNPLLLTIYSPTCGPCRDFLGRLDSFWETYGQNINLTKFSMRHQGMQVMSEHFKVDKVPTTLAVYQGSVLDVHVGAIDNKSIDELLSRYSSLESLTNSSSPKDLDQSTEQHNGEQRSYHAC